MLTDPGVVRRSLHLVGGGLAGRPGGQEPGCLGLKLISPLTQVTLGQNFKLLICKMGVIQCLPCAVGYEDEVS